MGVGKTSLATAIAHAACGHRFQALMTRADNMLRKLKQSRKHIRPAHPVLTQGLKMHNVAAVYLTLRRGDRLPVVAYGQWLLARHPALSGDSLHVDGIFGEQTQHAVLLAQRAESMAATGQLSARLWSALRSRSGDSLQTIESIGTGSVSDINSVAGIDYEVREDGNYLADGDPQVSIVVHYGSSFGLPGAIDRLLRGRPPGRCVLLRFHGHGAPGFMVVGGYGATGSNIYPHRSAGYRTHLARLRPLFGRFGSIELHGCRVGRGAIGLRSLTILAEATRVPVSAAYHPQIGASASDRFEGPVRTVFPRPMMLQWWARAQTGNQSVATL